MSTAQSFTNNATAPGRFPWRLSPVWQLIILAGLIFFAEIVSMIVLYFVDLPNYVATTLLDGFIMLGLISPGLYWIYLKPTLNYIEDRKRASDALQESERRLRNLLEILPVGVWITDAKGKIQHGNQRSLEIWGGARYVGIDDYGEYKGWWLESGKRIQPEDWAAARAINQGEISLNEEIEIECFDSSHKIILNSAVPIYEDGKKIAGTVVVNQDITALKRAQRELEARQALFRTAFDNLPVGVWLTDENGNITYGNPAGQAIWAGARYVGIENFGEYKAWRVNTGKRLEPDDWAVARAIKRGETSLNEELEIECFDGSHKIILNSAIPVRDDKQRILWAFVVNQDITARKQREQALLETNELLEKFFTSIGTLIAYIDRDFNFIRVNEAYARSAGHPQEFFLGKNHFDLYPHAENEAIFRRVVETGEPFSVFEKPFEYAEYPELGVTYWDWSLQPVKGGDDLVQGLVLSMVDVTRRKRAEIQLEQQNQELRELSQAERRQRELAEGLVKSSIAVSSSLNLKDVLDTILDQIHRAIPFQMADIALIENKMIHVVGYRSFIDLPEIVEVLKKAYPIDDFPLWLRVFSTQQPLFIQDTRDAPDWQVVSGMEWVYSYAVAPLVAGEQVIGFINLTSDQPGSFDETMAARLKAFTVPASVAIQNARLFEQVRASSERLQSLARKLVEIQENERYQIARELHDEAGQALAVLKISLGRLEQDPGCSQNIRQGLEDLKSMADGVLEELHRLAIDLRPIALDHLGLVVALEQYAKKLNSERLSIKFKALGFESARLPKDVETCLYRIVQEATANIVRHAQAGNVGILLERCVDSVKLFVEDDGIGFDPDLLETNQRLGLVGMRERAEMIGGTLTIESYPGKGTSIIVEAPDANADTHRR
jgi:PAS domain S-box-containing protein